MTLIKSLLFIFLLNGILVYFTKKKFEILVPFSFILVFLVLFAFSFIKHISYGYYFLWILIVGFYAYILVKRKDIKLFISNYFTVGMFVYLLLFVYAYFLQINRGFNYWDEFGHWGPMVKESFRLDKIYSVSASTLQRHKDYPPFFTLIELLWCYFAGSYSEGIVYVSILSFTFALFMPMFVVFEKEKKNIFKIITTIISTILICITIGATTTASDTARLFNSIYIDWPMAIFVAFTMYIIIVFENDTINNILVTLSFVSLLMMKQMGLPFYLLCLLLKALKLVFIEKIKSGKEIFKYLLMFVVIPAIFYFGWKTFIDYLGVGSRAQFKISDIEFNFISILKGTAGESWQIEAANNYMNAIVSRSLVTSPFNISYPVYSLFVCLVLLLAVKEKKIKLITVSTYLFGSIAYAFAMFLLYVYSFGSHEGPMLASFDRYLISYLFIGNCLLFMMTVNRMYKSKWFYVLPLIMFIFVETEDLSQLKITRDRESLFNDNAMAEILSCNDIQEDDRVLIIEQNNNDVYYYAMFGYLNGSNYCDVMKVGGMEWEGDTAVNLSLEEWEELLKQYDYLYVLSTNADLETKYLSDYYVADKSLYRINLGDNKTILEPIYCGY